MIFRKRNKPTGKYLNYWVRTVFVIFAANHPLFDQNHLLPLFLSLSFLLFETFEIFVAMALISQQKT